MKRYIFAVYFLCAVGAGSVNAANLAVSIGVRETQAGGGASGGPIFSDGGSTGGIELVNVDGQTLVADGTWQLFTFTPAADTVTAFAGTTANSILQGDWGTLEMIRIRNIEGITQPIRLWIDNVNNTVRIDETIENFEGYSVGDVVMFQEPGFSGSTIGNLVNAGTSAVSDTMAFAGSQSYEMNFQFVDDDPSRWARITTFNTDNVPNPAVRLQVGESNPTISFYAKAIVVPEPNALALACLAGLALLATRRRLADAHQPLNPIPPLE